MSTWQVVALVAAGGALGGMLRLVLSTLFDPRAGTLGANTLGSLALGMAAGAGLSEAWWALLATGFCGALTTWSTMAVQVHDSPPVRGLAWAAATWAAAVGAAVLGFALC